MGEYTNNQLVDAITGKLKAVNGCPYCGTGKWISYPKYAKLSVSNGREVEFEAHIPCGILICEACGHVELFALKALGINVSEKSDDVVAFEGREEDGRQ